MKITTSTANEMYGKGRRARERKERKRSCTLRDPVERAWWLGGWHDKDIESGVTQYEAEA